MLSAFTDKSVAASTTTIPVTSPTASSLAMDEKALKVVDLNRQVSISPTFYEQLFVLRCFCEIFVYSQFGIVIFWQKSIGAKAGR
jgi:hypothetical protein